MKPLLNISICLLLLACRLSHGQYITVPDTAFLSWMNINGLSSCLNGNQLDTTCSSLTSIKTADCSSKNIYDLTGISYFDSLEKLICSYNDLIALPPLPAGLKYLDCSANDLTSLPYIPPADTFLKCSNNNISFLPLLPTSLKHLHVNNNPLGQLPLLPASVTNLDCRNINLINLPVLPSSLTTLDCSNNPIGSITSLPSSLQYLYAEYCSLSSITSFPATLHFIKCNNNPLTSLPSVPASIKYIYAYRCSLTSIPALTGSNLEILDCSFNQLTSLPALPPTLKSLDCSYNQIPLLPGFGNQLSTLICNNNILNGLPALPASLLSLTCSGNPITSLPALPNSLTSLQCQSCSLNSLPSLPPALNTLGCSDNQISILPAIPAACKNLTCSDNLLTSIPALSLSMNLLGVANNTGITCLPEVRSVNYLDFSGTSITCLPNAIQSFNSNPPLNTLPICDVFNANGCSFSYNISGRVYKDSVLNCQFDAAEKKFGNIKINLYDDSMLVQQTFTDSDGRFTFDTDTGSYTITCDTSTFYIINCPANGIHTSQINVLDTLDYDINFSIACRPGSDLAAISMRRDSGQFRPGNYANVLFRAGDLSRIIGLNCLSTTGGSLKIIKNGPVNFVKPVTGSLVPTISGDTLIYSIQNFSMINYNSFAYVYYTDTTAQIGDFACFTMIIRSQITENDTSNNTLSQCFEIVNSYDPNAKLVNIPSFNAFPEWLTYTIQFQNTGNAPAQNIYLVDTLSSFLDMSTFDLLDFSHEPFVNINGYKVIFNFPNINLPDSVNNEPLSHGFVQFRIKTLDSLPLKTEVSNRAYIYFDFNPPVITNDAVSTFKCDTGIILLNTAICEGDSIFFNNGYIKTAGTYLDSLVNQYGCEIYRQLNLTVRPVVYSQISDTACANNGYNFNGVFLNISGIYQSILQSSAGCDSVITLDLHINPSYINQVKDTICTNETYFFGDDTLDQSGIFIKHFPNVFGCDSVVFLTLSVRNENVSVFQTTNGISVNGTGSYQWINCDDMTIIPGAGDSILTPTASGTYACIITSQDCIDTTACLPVVISGISDRNADRISVWPVPADDVLMVSGLQDNKISAHIYDMAGKIIQRLKMDVKNRVSQINVAFLQKGIYLIKITDAGHSENFIVPVR